MTRNRPKLSGEKGLGTIGILVFLGIVVMIIAFLWQVVPAYYDRYEIELALERTIEDVNLDMTDEEVLDVARHAFEMLKIKGHNPNDIEIEHVNDKVQLTYQYEIRLGVPFTNLYHPLVITVQR